ncbi:hypothetical protein FQR65_LT01804 [Abscondita terminalis]|nr:hypothetical protein FQR65_LT01804 [Abscondita terminalis]
MKKYLTILTTFLLLLHYAKGIENLMGTEIQKCLNCLCHARSGCWSRFNCARYSISQDYWVRAGSHSVSTHPDENVNYQNCMGDENCILNTIKSYTESFGERDCNCDGHFDCKDRFALHLFGDACFNPTFGSTYATRYMVAARNFKPGAIILSETPLVVGPLTNCEVQCLGCYKILSENGKYYKCKSCLWPLCSPNCDGFKKPYGHSEKECQVLTETKSGRLLDYKNFSSIATHFNAITPLRCLLLRNVNPSAYTVLQTMEAHNEIRQTIPEVWDSNQITVVDRIIKDWGLNLYSEKEIHTICGILEVNAFEIGQSGVNLRGLYPTAFLMSHNCVPNTNHTDEDCDYRLTVRASTEIEVEQPITLSYAYTLHGTMKRRDHLMDNKFFACKCSRCVDPTELGTYTSALRCPKCQIGWVLSTNPLNHEADWVCNNKSKQPSTRCPGYKVTANSILLLIARISKEADVLDCNDIEGMEAFLQKYRNVLHPNHYLCLGMKLSLSQLYGKVTGYIINDLSPEILKRKQDVCKEIMDVFDVLEPGFTRLRGVTLYELHAPIMMLTTKSYEEGKLTKTELRRRLKEVLEYLEEAALILGYEPESSSEHIMGVAAKDALLRIRDWEKIIGKL